MRLGEEENEVGQACCLPFPTNLAMVTVLPQSELLSRLFRLPFSSFTRRFSAFSRRLRRRRISFSRSRMHFLFTSSQPLIR